MLMRLVWTVAGTMLTPLLALVPDAPEPFTVSVPWPGWLPSWPVTLAIGSVLAAGTLLLILKFARWIYGLVPVVQ